MDVLSEFCIYKHTLVDFPHWHLKSEAGYLSSMLLCDFKIAWVQALKHPGKSRISIDNLHENVENSSSTILSCQQMHCKRRLLKQSFPRRLKQIYECLDHQHKFQSSWALLCTNNILYYQLMTKYKRYENKLLRSFHYKNVKVYNKLRFHYQRRRVGFITNLLFFGWANIIDRRWWILPVCVTVVISWRYTNVVFICRSPNGLNGKYSHNNNKNYIQDIFCKKGPQRFYESGSFHFQLFCPPFLELLKKHSDVFLNSLTIKIISFRALESGVQHTEVREKPWYLFILKPWVKRSFFLLFKTKRKL